MMQRALLFALWILFAATVRAEDFRIDRYNVDITVSENSVLDIKEEIEVSFRSSRHGIFRDIPYRYSMPGSVLPYSTLLFDVAVPGNPFELSDSGNYRRIRIGSPDEYVSGTKIYDIRYKVFGAIREYAGTPELYWNIIGDKWDVDIGSVTFRVQFPQRYNLTDDRYYAVAGRYGERGGPVQYKWEGSALTGFTTRRLQPREGVTVAVQPPPNALSNGTIGLRIRRFIANYGLFGIPAIVCIGLFIIWAIFGKDDDLPDMVHFTPPEDFTAAEAGVLIDDKVDNRDLTGLIVEWATKGLISIKEEELPSGPGSYVLHKIKPLPATARSYEHTIFNGLFTGRNSVSTDALKEKFYTVMQQARKQLDSTISELGLYEPGTLAARTGLKLAGVIALFMSFWFAIGAQNFLYLIVGLMSSFAILFFGSIIPKKSATGRERYQQINGFRQFMKRVQEPQLKLLLRTDPRYFDKTIAYAMVFGFAAAWCSRFEGLLAAPPEWFVSGPHRFNSFNNFGSSLERSVGSMNSAFVSSPAPQGGSGFSGGGGGSGGGFSGGGFGGGGGGSW